jgi:hypothetical protein
VGLDVYVGSLTRYHARDWLTVVQQAGQERNIPVEIVGPPPPDDAITDPEEIKKLVDAWRRGMAAATAKVVKTPWEWDESPSAPYFTDKPGWYGYNGVQMLAACNEVRLRLPKELPEDLQRDNAWVDASGTKRYAHLYHPAVWLPMDFDHIFQGPMSNGHEVAFGSSPRLVAQLRDLNQRTLKASSDDLARWRRADVVDGFPDDVADWTLELAAKFGLAIFLGLAEKSVEARLPMLLDW